MTRVLHNSPQWGFPQMDPIFTEFSEFSEFSEFRETDKITEAWMRVNLMILSVTCVFVVLWYHLCLWSMNEGQFNDPLCYLCLCGAVVSPLSLKQGPLVRVQQSFLILKKNCLKTFRKNSIDYQRKVMELHTSDVSSDESFLSKIVSIFHI